MILCKCPRYLAEFLPFLFRVAIVESAEARAAFVSTYYENAGYQGNYDGAAPVGSNAQGFRPGDAMAAIAGPVMPQTVSNILNQPPQFFQELALADGFDPRQFGNPMDAMIYA